MIEKLTEVKILFFNPQLAADHLNNVINNIEEWWNNKKTEMVKREILINYCNKANNIGYDKNLINFLEKFG